MTSSHTPTQSSWHSVLDDFAGITENLTVGSDSTDMLRELLIASGMTLKNPAGIIAANTRLIWGSAGAFRAAVGRAIGRDNAGPIAMPAGDKRFSDAAYQENPAYFVLAQQYLLFSQYVAELLDTAGVSGTREAKARFAAKFLVDALAPTNTLAGNPAAIRKAFDTGGKSIVKGLRNLAHDLLHNGGWPSQNPPNPKAKHWVNDSLPADPHEWKEDAQLVNATWWRDWTPWIAERGGEMIPAPDRPGSDEFPPIEKAPGSYVFADASRGK